MARRVSSTSIGAFVLASLGLAVIVAVVLGSGTLFTHPRYFICMFQGNLNGLKIGAAVKVKGVQIGTVEKIGLRLTPGEGVLRQVSYSQRPLPVIFQLNEKEFKRKGASGQALEPEEFQGLIQQGLRAQLNMESLLTGLLYIDLGFHPDQPAQFFIEPGSGPYPEIPTIPTDMEQIREDATKALAKIEKIDFNKLIDSITDAGISVKQLAGDPELHQAIDSFNRIVGDPSIREAISEAKVTLGNVNKAVISAKNVLDKTGPKIDPLIASLEKSSTDLQSALVQARSTMASAQLIVSPGSPITHKLDATLDELADASRSIHDLADYLQRNPSALIRGKYDNSR
jgi:phospholipid/cholesterol/gamma-HCH transport system substrate-binding protein